MKEPTEATQGNTMGFQITYKRIRNFANQICKHGCKYNSN